MNDYFKQLPTKRMSVGSIIQDMSQRILVVKPIYREDWITPGGVVEKNESPYAACKREISEELSLLLPVERLLVVNYIRATAEYPEGVHFVFYSGKIADSQINQIRLPQNELRDHCFVTVEQLPNFLNQNSVMAFRYVLEAIRLNTAFYLENHRAIGTQM